MISHILKLLLILISLIIIIGAVAFLLKDFGRYEHKSTEQKVNDFLVKSIREENIPEDLKVAKSEEEVFIQPDKDKEGKIFKRITYGAEWQKTGEPKFSLVINETAEGEELFQGVYMDLNERTDGQLVTLLYYFDRYFKMPLSSKNYNWVKKDRKYFQTYETIIEENKEYIITRFAYVVPYVTDDKFEIRLVGCRISKNSKLFERKSCIDTP